MRFLLLKKRKTAYFSQAGIKTIPNVIIPQRLETRRPFLEYIANGVSYLYEGTFIFKAGKQHTLELTIDTNPDQIEVEVGGEVGGW